MTELRPFMELAYGVTLFLCGSLYGVGLFLCGSLTSLTPQGGPEAPAKVELASPSPPTVLAWEEMTDPDRSWNNLYRSPAPGGWIVTDRNAAFFLPDGNCEWAKPKPEAEDILKFYVDADKATYDALEPLLGDAQNDELIIALMESWKLRIAVAENDRKGR